MAEEKTSSPKETVLVVDDDDDIRAALHDLLNGILPDVQVLEARSADQALALLDRGGIDLILSDYRMEGLDGLSLLQKASEIAPEIPRILMTAYGDMDLMINAINKAHVHKFINKPYDPEMIADSVWSLLEARRKKLPLDQDIPTVTATPRYQGNESPA